MCFVHHSSGIISVGMNFAGRSASLGSPAAQRSGRVEVHRGLLGLAPCSKMILTLKKMLKSRKSSCWNTTSYIDAQFTSIYWRSSFIPLHVLLYPEIKFLIRIQTFAMILKRRPGSTDDEWIEHKVGNIVGATYSKGITHLTPHRFKCSPEEARLHIDQWL